MLKPWAILGLLLFGTLILRAGEVVDRVVATVNGHVLLQSDWDGELRYECFMAGRSLHDLSPEDQKGAFDRLIDQELLQEQTHSVEFKPADSSEIEKQLQAVKNEFAQNHDPASWSAALSRYGISETAIRNHIALELNQLRLVDARLRPSIQIDAAAVEAYYKERFVPKLAAGQQMTLKEAAPKIRELLTQEKMNDLLSSWLETLHAQAKIRSFISHPSASQAQKQ